jgi:cytochrome c peroxidase
MKLSIKNISILIITCVIGLSTFFACKKKNKSLTEPTKIEFVIPNGWPQPAYNFALNPLTNEGFLLGKKIFYDPRLSSDGSVSCGNCHQQFASFVQFDHDFAHGVNGGHTSRNAQPLVNLAWHNSFMWDGGINNLEVQPIAPFTHPNEMNITLEQLVQKVNSDAVYKQMFKAAFGDETVNTQRILKALSQFMVMLTSSNSKYDKVKRGETSFTILEQLGYNAFVSKCSGCHTEPLFTDLSFRNIGLTINSTLNDKGRMGITFNRSDSLKFKVPTLRNAGLTYPYTHDGRYYSLERMIDHYRNDVVLDFSTDEIVRNKISITDTEKAALVAFIHTLTDSTFTKNPLFSER